MGGLGENKVYQIKIGIMIGGKIVEESGITNMKRIYYIKDKLNYKVNPQSVGAEGFEPPTPWV